jgi:hypothetical protein
MGPGAGGYGHVAQRRSSYEFGREEQRRFVGIVPQCAPQPAPQAATAFGQLKGGVLFVFARQRQPTGQPVLAGNGFQQTSAHAAHLYPQRQQGAI